MPMPTMRARPQATIPPRPHSGHARLTMTEPDPVPPDVAADAAAAPTDPATPEAAAAATAPATAPATLTAQQCADELKQRFPALFGGRILPLKLRIQADIQLRAPGVFSKPALSAFFRRYTGARAYLQALVRSPQRFDLDGAPAGELSAEHRQAAADELARRQQVMQQRQVQEQVNEQAQRAELEQQRRNRARLLRDFEATTLTLPNFCVLKGLAPDELPPLLEQARAEAQAEAPPPRPHPQPPAPRQPAPRPPARRR